MQGPTFWVRPKQRNQGMGAVAERQVPLNHFFHSPSQLNPLRVPGGVNTRKQAIRFAPIGHRSFAGRGVTFHFFEEIPKDGHGNRCAHTA